MEITLEMVDQVRERTGVSDEEAKAALEAANGNTVDAIIAIEKSNQKANGDLVEKIKAAVQEGNVTRIRVLRGGEEVINIPVNAGIAGGALALIASPWVLVSAAVVGAVAKFGFDCRFELYREDGSVDKVGGFDEPSSAEEKADVGEKTDAESKKD